MALGISSKGTKRILPGALPDFDISHMYWRKVARTQREIEMLRQWIEHNQIKDGLASADNVRMMANWIQARLATLEESVSVDSVERFLASRNLFPEVDHLIDPLADPPEEPRYAWQM